MRAKREGFKIVNDHSGISDINPDFCINFYSDGSIVF